MKHFDKNFIAVNKQDPVHFFEFDEFESIPTKTNYVLIPGGHNWGFFDQYDGNDVVMIHLEAPNCFIHGVEPQLFSKYDSKIRKVYSICPYTVEYFNKLNNNNKWESIWMPFNLKYIPEHSEKIFDVYYSGHQISCPLNLKMLNDYKKCIVSFDGGTHSGVDYVTKLKLASQSKISIVHNILKMPYPHLTDNYPTHQGLTLCKTHGMAPQLKTRGIEAAVSKSLILCFYDEWRLLEKQFTPNVDFLYWYDEKDLKEKISHILKNYQDYQPMIDSAYNKITTKWSTLNFFNQFLKDI
jgi:hypothetical protein